MRVFRALATREKLSNVSRGCQLIFQFVILFRVKLLFLFVITKKKESWCVLHAADEKIEWEWKRHNLPSGYNKSVIHFFIPDFSYFHTNQLSPRGKTGEISFFYWNHSHPFQPSQSQLSKCIFDVKTCHCNTSSSFTLDPPSTKWVHHHLLFIVN